MKNLTEQFRWIILRPLLVEVCKQVLLAINENTRVDEMCPGLIAIQGKPVSETSGCI